MKTRTAAAGLLLILLILFSNACGQQPLEEGGRDSSAGTLPQLVIPSAETSSSGQEGLPLEARAQQVLEHLGLSSSKIKEMDRPGILGLEPKIESFRFESFSREIYDGLQAFFLMRRLSDEPVGEKNLVRLSLGKASYPGEDSLWVLASSEGGSLPSLQKEILGRYAGEEGEWKPGVTDALPSAYAAAKKLVWRIEEICGLEEGPESIQRLLLQNGFLGAEDLYDHYYSVRLENQEEEKGEAARLDYWGRASSLCVFELPRQEVDRHAAFLKEDYSAQAQSIGLSLEEFWKLFAPEQGDMEAVLIKNAEDYIKRVLLIGALAAQEKIQVTDSELKEALPPGEGAVDEAVRIEGAFRLLEHKLLAATQPALAAEGLKEVPTDDGLKEAARKAWALTIPEAGLSEGELRYFGRDRVQTQRFEEMSRKLSALYERVQTGAGSEKETKLIKELAPAADYNGWGIDRASIIVYLAAEEKDLPEAVRLFEELVGAYEGVLFIPVSSPIHFIPG